MGGKGVGEPEGSPEVCVVVAGPVELAAALAIDVSEGFGPVVEAVALPVELEAGAVALGDKVVRLVREPTVFPTDTVALTTTVDEPELGGGD